LTAANALPSAIAEAEIAGGEDVRRVFQGRHGIAGRRGASFTAVTFTVMVRAVGSQTPPPFAVPPIVTDLEGKARRSRRRWHWLRA
jgi:hypothetical protein